MPRTHTALHAALAMSLVAASACSDLSSSATTTIPDIGSADTSAQLQAARDAADGTGLSLPIQGAFVTYVRPQLGGDVAGFFIQSQRPGPALFVAVDPATLTPSPRAGDQVELTVAAMTTVDSRREASAIDGYALVEAGVAIGTLQQELSTAADLVTGLDGYESELASVTGVLREDLTGAGDGFATAGLATAALPVEPNLVFRLPVELRALHDLTLGCRVTVASVPLWRTSGTAQVTAWAAADLDVEACPAPRVVSAAALSSTGVRVTFDRVLDPDSVLADGSQFTFDAGLTATHAELAVGGHEVTLTTGAQAGGTRYTVTVAPSVVDTYVTGIDPAWDQASFAGFAAPAVLKLSEVNASVTLNADLVELVAVTGGSVRDIELQDGVGTPLTLATLPDLVVAAGDVIVVHVSSTGVTTETAAKDQCTGTVCYVEAWDVAGGGSIPANSSRVLAVRSALGVLVDAVPFTDGDTTGGAGALNAFLSDVAALQSHDPVLWLPVDCGGASCTATGAVGISVSWLLTGATPEGDSVHRTVDDTDEAADWQVGASSFGLANY